MFIKNIKTIAVFCVKRKQIILLVKELSDKSLPWDKKEKKKKNRGLIHEENLQQFLS